jgi:hypothetical protein
MNDKPMTLIEAAQIAHADYLAATQGELDEQNQKNIADFLTAARKTAEVRLGATAASLDWTYTSPDDLPADTEEATALLAPGRWDWLRFTVADMGDRVRFELVQACNHCGHEEAHEVDSLQTLGELLAKGGAR